MLNDESKNKAEPNEVPMTVPSEPNEGRPHAPENALDTVYQMLAAGWA